jgi:UDP-3-O-[3-hydroxymyristoyl] glucosamine N-acyltransferase
MIQLESVLKYDPSLKTISAQHSLVVHAVSSIEEATDSTLCFVKNKKFFEKLIHKISHDNSQLGVVVFDEKFWGSLTLDQQKKCETQSRALLLTPNVAQTLTILSKPFFDLKCSKLNFTLDGRQLGTTEIHPTALVAQNVFIGEHVKIEEGVKIAPGCVILPHVTLGKNVQIYPNVSIYPFTSIGDDVRIHSGTTIGSDGFGYTFNQNHHQKIWHMGGVVIEKDVEIGANCTIDAGTFSPTKIGMGTKLDNGVQVAHNVQIGKHCILCGHVGISGSAILEDYVVLGGKAGVGPDAFVGAGSQIAGAAMVNEGAVWPKGSVLGGHPARDLKEWMRGFAYLRKASLSKDQK